MKQKTNTYWRKKCVEIGKKIAKTRDKYVCQRCGRSNVKIDASHIFPEGGYHGMSAMPENIKALCVQCHFWWHENPILARDWFVKKFPERYKLLLKLSRQTIKIDWKKEYETLDKVEEEGV